MVEFSDASIVMVTGAVNGISCLSTVQPDVEYRDLDALTVLFMVAPRAIDVSLAATVVHT